MAVPLLQSARDVSAVRAAAIDVRVLAGATAETKANRRAAEMSWLSTILKWFQAKQPTMSIDADGWLQGDGVRRIPADPSWYGGTLIVGGVVCHVSATNPGTAINMAKRRARKFGRDSNDRLASWHASVETDGSIVQMVPFSRRAHHAGSPTARKVPDLGWPNSRTLGIELIGWERGPFPPAQVEAYAQLLRCIVRYYGIDRRFAMITHASIDPGRRSDPGLVWMREHAEAVLEYAFAA